MPANLTGNPLSTVYSSFLHLSSTGLTGAMERVFDGTGNGSCMFISTSSISLSGALTVNGVVFPPTGSVENAIPALDGANNLIFRTLNYLLTAANASDVVDGNYSNPTLTMKDGLLQSVYTNGGSKTFFIASRLQSQAGPSVTTLIQTIQWPFPIIGDVSHVMQKVTNGSAMVDLDVFKFTYSASGWGTPVQY